MMSAGLTATLRAAASANRYPGATISLNFVTKQYWWNGAKFNDWRNIPGASFTRAATSYAPDLGGILRLFSSGQPAHTDYGLCVRHRAGTNDMTHNRDLTNAVWTATNMTVAKDGTGMDNVTNSCSRLTATAADATVIRAGDYGGTNVNRFAIKRVTGTGTVQTTQNNGATWLDTPALNTNTWIGCGSGSGVRPGIRLRTDTDVVLVDFGDSNNSAGWSGWPLVVDASPVARADDVMRIPLPTGTHSGPGTWVIDGRVPIVPFAQGIDNNTEMGVYNVAGTHYVKLSWDHEMAWSGGSYSSWGTGFTHSPQTMKTSFTWSATRQQHVGNTQFVTSSTAITQPTVTRIEVGDGAAGAILKQIAFWPYDIDTIVSMHRRKNYWDVS